MSKTKPFIPDRKTCPSCEGLVSKFCKCGSGVCADCCRCNLESVAGLISPDSNLNAQVPPSRVQQFGEIPRAAWPKIKCVDCPHFRGVTVVYPVTEEQERLRGVCTALHGGFTVFHPLHDQALACPAHEPTKFPLPLSLWDLVDLGYTVEIPLNAEEFE